MFKCCRIIKAAGDIPISLVFVVACLLIWLNICPGTIELEEIVTGVSCSPAVVLAKCRDVSDGCDNVVAECYKYKKKI